MSLTQAETHYHLKPDVELVQVAAMGNHLCEKAELRFLSYLWQARQTQRPARLARIKIENVDYVAIQKGPLTATSTPRYPIGDNAFGPQTTLIVDGQGKYLQHILNRRLEGIDKLSQIHTRPLWKFLGETDQLLATEKHGNSPLAQDIEAAQLHFNIMELQPLLQCLISEVCLAKSGAAAGVK